MSDSSALPDDPQHEPWEGELRSEYRDALQRLDRGLVAAGEGVIDLAQPLLAVSDRLEQRHVEAAEAAAKKVRAEVRSLEDDAFGLIARQAPVGPDLREIMATVRSLYDVVRAGRLAVHSIRSIAACDAEDRHRPEQLAQMRTLAAVVFTDGVAAWRNRDALAVQDLRKRDAEITVARDALWREIDEGDAELPVVPLVLLGRYLERYGDHGVAIAAHLSWAVTGDRVQDLLGGES